MNRSILFDSPFLLGFEHTRNLIERAAKAAAESYPPYNVEDRGDAGLRITLAVAGFTPETLCVTVEDRQLTIQGKRDGDQTRPDEAYLHRGGKAVPEGFSYSSDSNPEKLDARGLQTLLQMAYA